MKKLLLILAVWVVLNDGSTYVFPEADRWELDSAAFGPARAYEILTWGPPGRAMEGYKVFASFPVTHVKMVTLEDPKLKKIKR